MSTKPKTVKEAIAYLYTSRDIANRVQSWDAGALELIETEYERVTQRINRLRGYALVLEVKFAEEAGITDAEMETIRPIYLRDGDLPDDGDLTLGVGEA